MRPAMSEMTRAANSTCALHSRRVSRMPSGGWLQILSIFLLRLRSRHMHKLKRLQVRMQAPAVVGHHTALRARNFQHQHGNAVSLQTWAPTTSLCRSP